jgi:hypothetical protein
VNVEINAAFEPDTLKAYAKNEAFLVISVKNLHASSSYWCECDVLVKSPLSLAHDRELENGRTRIGIAKPGSSIEKKIKIFTRPNNFPDDYPVGIVAYVYEEDGTIGERIEHKAAVPCKEGVTAP